MQISFSWIILFRSCSINELFYLLLPTNVCNKFFQSEILLLNYWYLSYLSKLLTKLFD